MNEEQETGVSLGRCADQYYQIREKRLEINRQIKELQSQETRLKNMLIERLPKSDASGVAGSLARASIRTKAVPVVKDEVAFRNYIRRTGRYDLAQKIKPASAAIEELWDEGIDVPGIGRFNLISVSLNKL